MPDKRTILIIEDNELNREILCAILEDSYHVLTAENGQIGLEILYQYKKAISLILLDIQMPVMNGYTFLKEIRKNGQYTDIPIIVTTASNTESDEISCLEMGASDFVTKPYNPKIVRTRAESIIRLRETSALLHRIERDPVSGAYTRMAFLEHVANRLKTEPNTAYDMICLEIEGFPSLMDRYGSDNCDLLLRNRYLVLERTAPEKVLIGKLGDSLLAMFHPHESIEQYTIKMTDFIKMQETLNQDTIPGITHKCGVYENVDHSLSPDIICSNAQLALGTTSNRYGISIATYDNSIREKISRNQLITDNMEAAITERQFQVYYQPKHNVHQNKTGGAEALIRWIHPTLGFMSPGEFIPLFEHNGFIQKCDRYLLDLVCQHLRAWLDAGKTGVPVSINVSQTNFDNIHVADEFEAIVDQYHIPHDLINFEITESINASDAAKKKESVIQFHEKGFKVELDDFGSGYSSLSILGELPIDTLKIDMSLIRNMFEPKYSSVLKAALFAADDLNLSVVAEGVETKEQAQALKELWPKDTGLYIQGYYYSRPLPREQFEEYLITH